MLKHFSPQDLKPLLTVVPLALRSPVCHGTRQYPRLFAGKDVISTPKLTIQQTESNYHVLL